MRVITRFYVSHMLFLIFMMRISRKEESCFLITFYPLRPLRLCVIKYKKIPYVHNVAIHGPKLRVEKPAHLPQKAGSRGRTA